MRRITFCGGRAASYKAPTRDSRAEAVSWFERALGLTPESVDAQSLLASALARRALARMTNTPAEDFARAEALVRRVLAVSPRSSMAHYAYGQVLRASRRDERAIQEYQEALASNALNGEVERGAAELAEHYRLSGRVWVSTIADMKVTGYWGPPKIRELFWTVYFAGLRKLGVPEE